MNIQPRTVLTAVGNEETFRTSTATFSNLQGSAELALAQMVAYAFSVWHKGGDNKAWAINHIRDEVSLAKDAARRLDNALTRITRSKIEQDMQPARAALVFANEFVADFYRHETKARTARKAAADKRREEKAAEAKKVADAEMKAIKDEAKKNAEEAAKDLVEVACLALTSSEGVVTPLTEEEYSYLALTLSELRTEPKVAAVS